MFKTYVKMKSDLDSYFKCFRFIIGICILAVIAYSVALIRDVVVTLENSKSGNSKGSMLFLVHVLKVCILNFSDY